MVKNSAISLSLLVFLAVLSSTRRLVLCTENEICDNGEYHVEEDLGGKENYICSSEDFSAPGYFTPAGSGSCESPHQDYLGVCMKDRLSYQTHPPTYGAYRMMAPQYGEYKYLPPQRWLHTLKRGGVAFLYHPCADMEHVERLKVFARACLNKYVVTPYPHLTEKKPFAVVTWGCVFHMSWVNPPEIEEWLRSRLTSHDIQLGLDSEHNSQHYNKGLQRNTTAEPWSYLCEGLPDHEQTITSESDVDSRTDSIDIVSPSSSETTSKPCPTDTCETHKLVRTIKHHQTGLTVLIALLGIVLLGFVILLAWKLLVSWRRRRPKNQRYKTVSKYFPFSYEKQATEVIIPEVGMPKSGAAERQVLLDASDEDEL